MLEINCIKLIFWLFVFFPNSFPKIYKKTRWPIRNSFKCICICKTMVLCFSFL